MPPPAEFAVHDFAREVEEALVTHAGDARVLRDEVQLAVDLAPVDEEMGVITGERAEETTHLRDNPLPGSGGSSYSAEGCVLTVLTGDYAMRCACPFCEPSPERMHDGPALGLRVIRREECPAYVVKIVEGVIDAEVCQGAESVALTSSSSRNALQSVVA